MVAETGDEVFMETFKLVIQPQVSFTLMDQNTGQVKALVGGRGEKTENRSFNRATEATRQPGSCFKIVATYLPALDACNMSLATVYDDAPYYYEMVIRYLTGTADTGDLNYKICYHGVYEYHSCKVYHRRNSTARI